jgi:hypothetical protein
VNVDVIYRRRKQVNSKSMTQGSADQSVDFSVLGLIRGPSIDWTAPSLICFHTESESVFVYQKNQSNHFMIAFFSVQISACGGPSQRTPLRALASTPARGKVQGAATRRR